MNEKEERMLKTDEWNEIYWSKRYQSFGGVGWHQRSRHRCRAVLGGIAIEVNKGGHSPRGRG